MGRRAMAEIRESTIDLADNLDEVVVDGVAGAMVWVARQRLDRLDALRLHRATEDGERDNGMSGA